MRPPGQRREFQPGRAPSRRIERTELGDRVRGVRLVAAGERDALAARAGALGERRVDPTLARPRHAHGHRPIGLLGVARAERRGEPARSPGRAREQQHAGGVAVEPVHQPRPLVRPEAQRIEQRIEALHDPGPALHRQAERLVEHEHAGVTVEHQALEILRVARIDPERSFRSRRIELAERRDADALPRREAGAGLGAPAVHAHLPGAQQLGERAMGEAREMAAEPAVQPDFRLVLGDGSGLDGAHVRCFRLSRSHSASRSAIAASRPRVVGR